MRIKIDNVSSESIAAADRIEKDEIAELQSTMEAIQNAWREEAKDYNVLVENLRAWTKCHDQRDVLTDITELATSIRAEMSPEALVTVGIGGSDLGGRTLHACLNSSQHNMLSKKARGGAPEVYFVGDTFDPGELFDMLQTLEERDLILKTVYNIISKSGTTSETVAAFLTIKASIEKALEAAGRDKAEYAQYIVATTGLNDKSELYNMNENQKVKFRGLLPVPDGVGGRFSFASAVGLFFLAMTTNEQVESIDDRIAAAIKGLKDAENDAYKHPLSDENVASNIAMINYLAEKKGKTSVVFYPYAKTLKLIGDWYTQLSTESLQEKGQGQNVIPTCGPTGNHSILNGVVGGPRDKVILFIRVEEFQAEKNYTIPTGSGIGGELAVLEGKTFGFIQNASQLGTENNLTDNGVLNVTISLPKIDTYNICKLLYTLQCVVAFEGDLRGLGRITYEQAGVEGYKKATRQILSA